MTPNNTNPQPNPHHSRKETTTMTTHPPLDHYATQFVLNLHHLSLLTQAPLTNNAWFDGVSPTNTLEYTRRQRIIDHFKATTPTTLIHNVALQHALADLGVRLEGTPENPYVHPVIPGVGTLATMTTEPEDFDALHTACALMGGTKDDPHYPTTCDTDGNHLWPLLIAGVEEEFTRHITPHAREFNPNPEDVVITAAPIPWEEFTNMITNPGFNVATSTLCDAIGMEYRGPQAGADTSLNALQELDIQVNGDWRTMFCTRDTYQKAQAAAIESLLLRQLLQEYHLEDIYSWSWGTHTHWGTRAMEEIEEIEAAVAEVEKTARLERIKRERAAALIPGDVELVAPNAPEGNHLTLVNHLVARGQTTAVTGPQGGGKSRVLRELAATIATDGRRFAGRFPAHHTGGVLYVDMENNQAGINAYRQAGDGLDQVTLISADTGVRIKSTGTITPFPAVLAHAADGNQVAIDTVLTLLAHRGPYVALVVDGFKRLVEMAGYSEKQEECAARLVRGLETLAMHLNAGGDPTLVVSTHTTRNDEITSGVAIDRYADIIVRLRTTAKPGVTPGPCHTRSLESAKRADLAGGALGRTRLVLEDGRLVLDSEPMKTRPQAGEVELVQAEPVDPLEAAVLRVAPAPGQAGVGMRVLTEAAGKAAGVGRRQVKPVVLRMVEDGRLTDQAPKPQGGRSDYVYYGRA